MKKEKIMMHLVQTGTSTNQLEEALRISIHILEEPEEEVVLLMNSRVTLVIYLVEWAEDFQISLNHSLVEEENRQDQDLVRKDFKISQPELMLKLIYIYLLKKHSTEVKDRLVLMVKN